MYEAISEKMIGVLDALPKAASQASRHQEVREAAGALDNVADTIASHSTDTNSNEAQAGRAVADGFRAAAQLCRLAIQ